MAKVRMINGSQGIPTGEELEVADDRAERWVFVKQCAVFVEKKDEKAAEKRIEEAKKKAEQEQKELDKKLKQLDEES